MSDPQVILITGTHKGIGKHLVEHYVRQGHTVIGCSRGDFEYELAGYNHFCLDVADEPAVKAMFVHVRKRFRRLDVLINNAGIASMNHAMLTPLATVDKVMKTNFGGTFLFCREAAKLMLKTRWGRIVNFTTVSVPLKLEGEAVYAASKAAVESLTAVLAKEFGGIGITVNAIGPTVIRTDLVRNVPQERLDELRRRQAIRRLGEFRDVTNVIDFFIQPESDFVTGQVIYLGGI